jgi:hypothetical protein
MARLAGDLRARIDPVGQRVEPAVDLLDHHHHLSRDLLGSFLVAGKIELLEREPFFPNVTELAANPEVTGEVAHGADDLDDGRRARDHPDIDE